MRSIIWCAPYLMPVSQSDNVVNVTRNQLDYQGLAGSPTAAVAAATERGQLGWNSNRKHCEYLIVNLISSSLVFPRFTASHTCIELASVFQTLIILICKLASFNCSIADHLLFSLFWIMHLELAPWEARGEDLHWRWHFCYMPLITSAQDRIHLIVTSPIAVNAFRESDWEEGKRVDVSHVPEG